jgi:phosphoribosylglycinamide formyltransferase-1
MLWMDDETCMEYDMLNLHPALPDGPKGTWQEVIWQLIREGADRQGAMLHLCTPEWDRGAPLTYCGFSLRGEGYDNLWDDLYKKLEDSTLEDIAKSEGVEEPLFKKIRADGAKRELPLIVETIRSFADGRVRIENKQLVANGKKLDTAFDLSAEVDRSIGE